MEMDDIARDVLRQGAQLASVVLSLTQQLQARREARAHVEQKEAADERRELAQRLTAERESALTRLDRTQLPSWQPHSDRELVELWVSASMWESHDQRADVVRPQLERRLVEAGIPAQQLAEIRTSGDVEQAAARITAIRHERRERANSCAVTAMVTEAATESSETGAAEIRTAGGQTFGNVYGAGSAAARTAGESYPMVAENAVATHGRQRARGSGQHGQYQGKPQQKGRGR